MLGYFVSLKRKCCPNEKYFTFIIIDECYKYISLIFIE